MATPLDSDEVADVPVRREHMDAMEIAAKTASWVCFFAIFALVFTGHVGTPLAIAVIVIWASRIHPYQIKERMRRTPKSGNSVASSGTRTVSESYASRSSDYSGRTVDHALLPRSSMLARPATPTSAVLRIGNLPHEGSDQVNSF
jgi:hypothetical protein